MRKKSEYFLVKTKKPIIIVDNVFEEDDFDVSVKKVEEKYIIKNKPIQVEDVWFERNINDI